MTPWLSLAEGKHGQGQSRSGFGDGIRELEDRAGAGREAVEKRLLEQRDAGRRRGFALIAQGARAALFDEGFRVFDRQAGQGRE
jgi:hypothetical protein